MAGSDIELPDKLYFSIGEVSKIVQVAPHVLRYWEKMFPQVKPVKRSGKRRYYRQQDVHSLLEIRHLLYERRFTVDGARKHLKKKTEQTPQDLLDTIRAELTDIHKQLVTAIQADQASVDGES